MVGIALLGSVWISSNLFKPSFRLSAAEVQARGEQTQERFEIYLERLDRYYGSLRSALETDGQTDLLRRLEPPQEIPFGYQILPNIVAEKAPHESGARMVGYSWTWTDKLIGAATQALAQAEMALGRIAAADRTTRQPRYEELAVRYLELRSSMRNIGAHVQYNRFWQTAFAANLERSGPEISAPAFGRREMTAAAALLDTPEFIRLERVEGHWLIDVSLYTDIEDRDFLRSVKENVEAVWRLRSVDDEFRVRVNFIMIAPARLYVQSHPPPTGADLVLEHHLSLFPPRAAILTTGARTTHVWGRAILLGPEDISGRVLAHEMGHILGFSDSYVRRYKDLGADGYQIVELTGGSNDIMASPASGAVLASHFYKLVHRLKPKPILRSLQHEMSSTDRRATIAGLARSVELPRTSVRVASA